MNEGNRFDRRRFLGLGAAGGLTLLSACSAGSNSPTTSATTQVPNAEPLDPAVAAVEAGRPTSGRVVRHELRAAPTTLGLGRTEVETWAYDGQLPGREIRVTQGDILEVALRNDLPEDTTIHWHGLAIRNDMDGVHDLTQPSVRPGEVFTYRFVVPDPGTYWFHPHMGLQLDRALYAPLVVEARDDPGRYDVDQVIILDDWLDGIGGTPDDTLSALVGMDMGDMDMGDMGHGGMGHEEMGHGGMDGMVMFQSFLLGGDAGDVDYPFHLINGRPPSDRPTFDVPAGGRIRLRFVNAGSDTAYRIAVGGHRLTVTHSDGFPIEPVEVDTLVIGMGERYDVLVAPTSGAWPLVALAEGKDLTAAAVIRTSDATVTEAPPAEFRPTELEGRLLTYRDLTAVESARIDERSPDVERAIRLTGSMMPYAWGFDGASFPNTPVVQVEQGQRVRLSFENTTTMWHPIHLHGHTFRLGTSAVGPRKDNVNVLPGETVVIDFDANNPGGWMVHCHNTYHLERGMAMVVAYA